MRALVTPQRRTDLVSLTGRSLEDTNVLSRIPVRAPIFYVATLTLGVGPRLLLAVLLEAALKHRPFAPTQARLGQVLHRDARTVRRWVRALKRRGLIYVKRRGRGRSNLYHVHRRLWDRLAGRRPSEIPQALQDTLWRIGLKIGVPPSTMRGRGVAPAGRFG